jgi:hypothetical protein
VYVTTLAELDDEQVGPAPVILLIGHAIQLPADGAPIDTAQIVEEVIRL